MNMIVYVYKSGVDLMELLNAENYENTRFHDETFPFSCFYIKNANTLPHWHNHLEIVVPENGICNVIVNGSVFNISENQLFIVPPGSMHSIIPRGNSHYYAIVIGETLLEGFHSDRHIPSIYTPVMAIGQYTAFNISYSNELFDKCHSLICELIYEKDARKKGYQARIKCLLILLFSIFSEILPANSFISAKISDSTVIIKSSLEYLQLHYKENIRIVDMSHQYHISVQHFFSRLFKTYTGKTFVEYLTAFRLGIAKKLLMGTDLPVSRIPELTGFCNGNTVR